MPEHEQKKQSAIARYNDALARLREEERRFDTRQKIILGGAMIALRRNDGEAGAKLLRALIPYISDDDRPMVSNLLDVRENLSHTAPDKAERRRDAVVVAAARKALRERKPIPDDDDSDDDESAGVRVRQRPSDDAWEL